MGVVYAGVDARGRRAAVKLVHPELAHDGEFRARFAREVAILRRVAGTCTVRILDADVDAKRPWLATEYVPGPTLDQHVTAAGPLTGDQLIALAAGLAEAIKATQAAGVVHRDLKPSNVILSPNGPRLVDMGIARQVDETSLTGTGVLVGSPGWISPEEYRGAEVGPPADVYGWGLLVLYAATGRMAFGKGRPEVIAVRVLTDEPDLEGVPASLKELVAKALSKNPDERPDAAHLLESVRRIWHPDAPESESAEDDVTRLLDRTWVMPMSEEPEWVVPRRRFRKNLSLAVAVTAVGAVLVGAVTVLGSGAAGTGASPDRLAGSRTQPAASPTRGATQSGVPADQPSAIATGSKDAIPGPTSTQSRASIAREGRRVTMVKGYSFVLPDDWIYFPDNTHDLDAFCLRPKDKQDDEYWFCHQFGMSINPWWDDNVEFNLDDIGDPDEINGTRDPYGPCGESSSTARPGRMVKAGLHRIGDRKAYYRKARSYCRDGTTVETELLVLPVTRLTIVIDKLPPKRREQVEEILRSFKFPD
jgi:Serine/threonine protein kinase